MKDAEEQETGTGRRPTTRPGDRPARVTPRTLKGFRDTTPALMMRKEALIDRLRLVLRRYGFVPIDTPALEYAEVLLAKAGGDTEKQVYRFRDQGGRDVAMRFDLTVPLARFAAMHVARLGSPFKRYHIGPVWRGENTARGRFREFWQCDFDTIGTTSPMADLETALLIHRLLTALDIGGFTLHISDRTILSAWLEKLGVAERRLEVLRAIDKLRKVGKDGVRAELETVAELDPTAIRTIFELIEIEGGPPEILSAVRTHLGDQTPIGVPRLELILEGLEAGGIEPGTVRLDLSITRGLDYYTGTIYEAFLDGQPELGSVCSGGRYDDLAALYTREPLPGVGASLGLDRLLDATGGDRPEGAGGSSARVLVLLFAGREIEGLRLGEELRAAGISTEVYMEPRKMQKQLQHAGRRGFEVAVIAGPDELDRGVVSVKNLGTQTQGPPVPRARLVAEVRSLLGGEADS